MTNQTRLRLNAFGRLLDIERIQDRWQVFDKGNEGKRRLATDIFVPDDLAKDDIIGYLDDLLHEYSNAQNPKIIDLDQ